MESNVKEVEFLRELIKKCEDRINVLTTSDVVEQDEDLTMDDEVAEEPALAQKPTVDPNLNNPISIPAEKPADAPVEKPAEEPTEKPTGLTNFKEALEPYPNEIELVNPAQVKVAEKTKSTMFKKPKFDDISKIEIDVVNPNPEVPVKPVVAEQPAPAEAQAVEQAAQFGPAPVAPAPGITPGQFTDGTNNGQSLAA